MKIAVLYLKITFNNKLSNILISTDNSIKSTMNIFSFFSAYVECD